MALSLNTARMSAVRPSATLAMAAKAKAMQKAGIDVANLSAGEPDFKTPACIVDYARRALEERAAHAYTNARGTDEMIDAMRAKLRREQYTDYGVNEVIATVGTKGALMLAIDALVGSTQAKPRVDVAAGENLAGTEVWLRVRDNGPGIEPERLEQIWTPFHTSKSNGTGLGLPITRKVVETHGGTIEVESPPGGGTEFRVVLPKAGLARNGA